MMLSVHH